jgi:hypothetical protein
MEEFKILLKYLERYGYPNKNIKNLFIYLKLNSK